MSRAVVISLSLMVSLANGCKLSAGIAEELDAAIDSIPDTGSPDSVSDRVRFGVSFHGIEGYGRTVRGGRTGDVYEVTTLGTSGPGSLADAVSGDWRIIVFRVSGYIDAGVTIRGSHLTIAGQTAPGGGITIRGGGLTCADGVSDIIIRFLHVRPGYAPGGASDAIGCRFATGVVVDHVSASWGTDENLSIYGNDLVTVQWSIASEALNAGSHSWGGLWGGERATFHHNLLASNANANPEFSGPMIDARNNVVYNWAASYPMLGGADGLNLVANYYKAGPATPASAKNVILSPTAAIRAYLGQNFIFGYPDVTANNDLGVTASYSKVVDEISMEGVWTDAPELALTNVLKFAGDCLHRDAVDDRIIADVRNGTGKIIDRESDVGGWPVLQPGTPPVDSDHDGIPDTVEVERGTDPNDYSDGASDPDNDGYTEVEEYLQGITSPCFPRW